MKVTAELLIWKSKFENARVPLIPGMPNGPQSVSRADASGMPWFGLLICPLLTGDIRVRGETPDDVRNRAKRALDNRIKDFLSDVEPGTMIQEPVEVEYEP